jgi:hypothetical protein
LASRRHGNKDFNFDGVREEIFDTGHGKAKLGIDDIGRRYALIDKVYRWMRH